PGRLRRVVPAHPYVGSGGPPLPRPGGRKLPFVTGGDRTMTVCAIETAAEHEDGAGQAGCTITADGCYAARLALAGDSPFPERWTLDGPEPYRVRLPGDRPERP